MKKFRGKCRYCRHMWATINMYDWQIDDNMWFAFTHHHLDFFGYGNRSGKLRRTHIKGHLALFERTLAQLAYFQKTVPSVAHLT